MVSAQYARASSAAQASSSFTLSERFGPELLKLGWTAIPNLLLDAYAQLGISPAEMMFTIHVFQHWWGSADPHPSLATIAQKMGISWRQAQRYAHSLARKKLLILQPRSHPDYGQISNEYDFSPLLAAVLELTATHLAEPSLAEARVTPVIPPLSHLSEGPLSSLSYEEDPTSQEEQKDKGVDLRNSNPPLQIQIQTETSRAENSITQAAHRLSAELGDAHHELSNTTRLAKLLQWSELESPAFLAVVEQACHITLGRQRIWKGANRMPYFFSVLCNLLGVVEEKPSRQARQAAVPAKLAPQTVPDHQEDPETAELLDEPSHEEQPTAKVWRQVQQQLQAQLTQATYQTWVMDTELRELEGNQAVVGVPTKFAVEWLQKRCERQIQEALARVMGLPVSVRFQHSPTVGR